MSLKFDTKKWSQKVKMFPFHCYQEIDKAYLRLVTNATKAMNEGIEDYPGSSSETLQEVLQREGLEPMPGTLRKALFEASVTGNRTIKYGSHITRNIIDYNILNSKTPWNGKNGKRPIQSPNHWEQNPYRNEGFWRTYNDGFTWDSGARIIGRNFLRLGEFYLQTNFKREMELALKRVYYYINKY